MRLKHLLTMRSGSGITSEDIEEDGEFPVYGGNGVRGFASQYTHDGTFVLVGRQGALCGNVKLVSGRFWASEHAVVCAVRAGHDARWIAYLLHGLNLNQYSVSAAQPGLAVERIAALQVAIPPGHQQRAIAGFLDRKTGAIDALIEKKERIVSLLAEKKASAIEAFALRGVHAGPMKDSGIPSVGVIPATWRVQRAKTIFAEFTQRAGTADLELLSVSHITGVTPRREKPDVTMFLAESSADNKVCRRDDLVVNTMWAWMGAVGVTPCDGMVSPSYNVYRLRNPAEFAPRYFDLLLRTPAFIAEMNRHSKGITASRLRLYPEAFLNMLLPLPPRDEQVAILRAVEVLTGGDAGVSARLVKSVEALREYRQALITAAVTGQLDVGALGAA